MTYNVFGGTLNLTQIQLQPFKYLTERTLERSLANDRWMLRTSLEAGSELLSGNTAAPRLTFLLTADVATWSIGIVCTT